MSDSGFFSAAGRRTAGRPFDLASGLTARSLAGHPAYRGWQGRPIPDEAQRLVEQLDPQQLMGLAAACLLRLDSSGRGPAEALEASGD